MRNAVKKEYSRFAEEYDSRWSFYVEATTKATLSTIDLKESDKVLDVGCGTGVLLKHLTESYPATQLYGVDPVKEMLSAARQRLPATVDLQVGWANQLPFEDYYFDVVISNSVFHHIPDAQAALQEIQRVLRPQGTFILTDWCRDYFTIRIIDYFLKKFNDAYFQSYRSSDMTRLLKENNFTILDMDSYRINPWWGLVAVKASSSGRPGTAN